MPSYERKQLRKAMEVKLREKSRERAPELRQIAQAAVSMDKLTHTPEWDFYLQIVQDTIDELGGMIQTLQDRSLSSPSFESHEMASMKARTLEVLAQKRALEQVLGLPKQIMEKGKDAKLSLERIADE